MHPFLFILFIKNSQSFIKPGFILELQQESQQLQEMNKKPILNLKQQKNHIIQNPYNDQPVLQQTKSLKNINNIGKISPSLTPNNQNGAFKLQNKAYIPDPKIVQAGINTSKKSKDLINKIASDVNSKLPKNINRHAKYNDYFDNGVKPIKRVADISKNSAESNSSIKSIKSQDNKNIVSSKILNKNNKINYQKQILTKPKIFPICLKNKKPNQIQLKINCQLAESLKMTTNSPDNKLKDNRKSWSHHNGFGVQKNCSQQLIKKTSNLQITKKNPTKTVGNPEVDKKTSPSKNKPVLPIRSPAKLIVKKDSLTFIPSSSSSSAKLYNQKSSQEITPEKGKNHINAPKLSVQQNKFVIIQPPILVKQQKCPQYLQMFKQKQIIKLKIISLSNQSRYFTFIVKKVIQIEQNTSLYLVSEILTETIYCLKKCKVIKQENPDSHALNTLEYLLKQGKIGCMIDHPYLVKTYCTLVDGSNNIYQLMEYIQGQNLYERNKKYFCQLNKSLERDSLGLRKNSLSRTINKMSIIRQILSQLIQGLCYLHEKNITHRDIKPANILITQMNTYKIGDFGTAIWKPSIQPIGTLDYAAPQVMMKEPCDSSNDMWAIGCIAFQLYVGYPPFYNQDRQVTIQKIVNCQYQHYKIQDENLANFISKLLQRKKEKRMTAKQALTHPFLKQLASILD